MRDNSFWPSSIAFIPNSYKKKSTQVLNNKIRIKHHWGILPTKPVSCVAFSKTYPNRFSSASDITLYFLSFLFENSRFDSIKILLNYIFVISFPSQCSPPSSSFISFSSTFSPPNSFSSPHFLWFNINVKLLLLPNYIFVQLLFRLSYFNWWMSRIRYLSLLLFLIRWSSPSSWGLDRSSLRLESQISIIYPIIEICDPR